MEINAYQRSIQTISHSFKFPAHQQDVSQRSAAVSHLNMDGETQDNNKHAKTTMDCVCLLFSILTFSQNSHWDLFFQRKPGNSFSSSRRYKLVSLLHLNINLKNPTYDVLFWKAIFAKICNSWYISNILVCSQSVHRIPQVSEPRNSSASCHLQSLGGKSGEGEE